MWKKCINVFSESKMLLKYWVLSSDLIRLSDIIYDTSKLSDFAELCDSFNMYM